MGKRRTRPYYLSEDEYDREQERLKRMVESITGVRDNEKSTPLTTHAPAHERISERGADSQPRQPKASFRIRFNDTDNLQLTIWSGKQDPDSEVIVAAIQRRQGDTWEKIGRIAVYRSSDGTLRQLPERIP